MVSLVASAMTFMGIPGMMAGVISVVVMAMPSEASPEPASFMAVTR